MQNWTRLYHYIHEYQYLVYSLYANHHVAFLTTYWNINSNETVWDNTNALGGSYERIGDHSGIKFNKYLLLPVYFPDEITSMFDALQTGYVKNQETSVVIPSTYGITPYPGDFVKLEQEFLNPNNNTYPLFIVTGVEIHPNTERRFWKLKLKAYQSKSINDINEQVNDTLIFFDYDKQIHTLDESIILTRLLAKNSELKNRLSLMFDQNSGLLSV
jgi:hypothetical protein